MAEILVLAEHVGDDVKKVTLELITLARRFGELQAGRDARPTLYQSVPVIEVRY